MVVGRNNIMYLFLVVEFEYLKLCRQKKKWTCVDDLHPKDALLLHKFALVGITMSQFPIVSMQLALVENMVFCDTIQNDKKCRM